MRVFLPCPSEAPPLGFVSLSVSTSLGLYLNFNMQEVRFCRQLIFVESKAGSFDNHLFLSGRSDISLLQTVDKGFPFYFGKIKLPRLYFQAQYISSRLLSHLVSRTQTSGIHLFLSI